MCIRDRVTETAGQGEKLMDFSINKGGSIFSLDDNTMKLVKDYYVQKVYHCLLYTSIISMKAGVLFFV